MTTDNPSMPLGCHLTDEHPTNVLPPLVLCFIFEAVCDGTRSQPGHTHHQQNAVPRPESWSITIGTCSIAADTVLWLMGTATDESAPAATEGGARAGAAATMADRAMVGTLSVATVMMAMQVAHIWTMSKMTAVHMAAHHCLLKEDRIATNVAVMAISTLTHAWNDNSSTLPNPMPPDCSFKLTYSIILTNQ